MKIENPKGGDTRIVTKFAFLPITTFEDIDDVWFKRVSIQQMYVEDLGCWVNMRFVGGNSKERYNDG